MSLLGSIGKAISGVGRKVLGSGIGRAVGAVIPGAGVVGTIAGSVLADRLVKKKAARVGSNLPAVIGNLPPIPPALQSAAGAAAGGAAGYLAGMNSCGCPKKRRRRKGISGKDLQSFKRVARLVDKYSKPVHSMRNYKKG